MAALPAHGIDAKLKAELTGLLSEELQLCESLLTHIRHEQQCLREHDHVGFTANAEQKSAVVLALRQLDQRRQTLFKQLQATDLQAAQQSFDLWLTRFQRDPSLSTLIQKLRHITAACAKENQSLGRLIQLQTRFFDFLLKQLLPQRLEGLTYLSSGEKQNMANVRKLASA
jgi:flagellar biosynthesis/type III secretory pathway chaperone